MTIASGQDRWQRRIEVNNLVLRQFDAEKVWAVLSVPHNNIREMVVIGLSDPSSAEEIRLARKVTE